MSNFQDADDNDYGIPEDIAGEPIDGGDSADDPAAGRQAETGYEPEESGQSDISGTDETDDDFPDYSPEINADPAVSYDLNEDNGSIPENDDSDALEEDPFTQDEPEPIADGELPGEAGEPLSTHEDDRESPGPYTAAKKSPGAVIKSRPSVLNRQLILYIIGGVVIFFLLFAAFILPLIQSHVKRSADKKKQTPTSVSPADYYSLVPHSDAGKLNNTAVPDNSLADKFWEGLTDDELIDSLPPVDERYQHKNPPGQTTAPTSTGGGSPYVRPDTRNDRLQAKHIQGIKGITPTQARYLTGSGQLDSTPLPVRQYSDPDNANPYRQFGMPPKEEYLSQMLALQQEQRQQVTGIGSSSYAAQNDQSGKTAFYNQGRDNAGGGSWLPPASIWQGTVFEAVLTSRINTDLPGECTAMVSKNIYSSQDGKYLLIPQNSRLLGTYNSSISYSQKRVQVGWHTLIRPDGYYLNLGNMQGTDPRGAAGLPGNINEHPWQYMKAIILLSVMNIVNSELAYSMAETNNQYVQNVMANTQEIANVLGGKLIDRAMDVQPTITINEGAKINIVANYHLVLPPMPSYPVTYPYRRGE
jgi:type IV secretion system protein VirB10